MTQISYNEANKIESLKKKLDSIKNKKPRRIVMTKDNKVGYVYENEFIESQGIDKIPVYITENLKPTGEKLLCNPNGLTLMGFLD